MTARNLSLTLSLVLGLAAAGLGQIKVGDQGPSIEAKELINTKAKSYRDFRGKLLLVEYFAHW